MASTAAAAAAAAAGGRRRLLDWPLAIAHCPSGGHMLTQGQDVAMRQLIT